MRKIISRLFGKRSKKGVIIPPAEHNISPDEFSSEVLEVAQRLQAQGHTAYIVGGAVRDLLLGFHPKDFDIATDATPQQIQSLFRRRSRMIGRRFPIVHVYAQRNRRTHFREFTEVTTFRGNHPNPTKKRDYGTASEDAHRRDFSINGIFYDPASGDIHDYVGGVADIRAKNLCMIGSPNKRLPEDPLRILRALRFSTKLGLMMSDQLERQLVKHAPLLAELPKARLFDEFAKVCQCGASARVLQQWRQFGICRHVIPILEEDNPFFFSIVAENDRRHAEKRATSLSFITAALFWQHTARVWHDLRGNGVSSMRAMEEAIGETPFRDNMIIPQKLTARAKDLYFMQAQMENTATVRRAHNILHKTLFDRALAFASLRHDTGAAQTASWWAQFAQGGEEERNRLLDEAPRKKRRRQRHKRQRAKSGEGGGEGGGDGGGGGGGTSA